MHVHACADSCALLVNLLQYVTRTGDLHPPPRPPSPTEIAGQKVQVRPGPSPAWSPRTGIGEPPGCSPSWHSFPTPPLPGPALREPRLPALVPPGGDGPHQPAGPDRRPPGHRAQPAGAGPVCRWVGRLRAPDTTSAMSGSPKPSSLLQVAPSLRPRPCPSTCSQVNGVGPNLPRPLWGSWPEVQRPRTVKRRAMETLWTVTSSASLMLPAWASRYAVGTLAGQDVGEGGWRE